VNSDRVERIDVEEETLKEGETIGKPQKKPNQVTDHLENMKKKKR
jgi:hypothetical protein